MTVMGTRTSATDPRLRIGGVVSVVVVVVVVIAAAAMLLLLRRSRSSSSVVRCEAMVLIKSRARCLAIDRSIDQSICLSLSLRLVRCWWKARIACLHPKSQKPRRTIRVGSSDDDDDDDDDDPCDLDRMKE